MGRRKEGEVMFGFLKRFNAALEPEVKPQGRKFVSTGRSLTTVLVPMDPLIEEFKSQGEGEYGRTPAQVVVIYNVKELAAEIAKCLKSDTTK